jgi:hypothetical protein
LEFENMSIILPPNNGWPAASRRNFIIGVTLLAVICWCSSWIYDSFICPPFGKLTEEHEGCNFQYRQYKKPSAAEIEAGRNALKQWKGASRRERQRLAGALVVSKILIGMTQSKIVSFMGPPDAFGALHDIAPDIKQTGYNAADGESVCDLLIEIEDAGKVSDAYLDVNY